jgi:hypothetical protein
LQIPELLLKIADRSSIQEKSDRIQIPKNVDRLQIHEKKPDRLEI